MSKIRKLTLPKMKKRFWKIFSQYIRMRDGGVCFTCGIVKDWKEQHAGHFFTAASCGLELYFHEQNVHCQCFRCNINLSGNWTAYYERFIERYGIDWFKQFQELQKQGNVKYTIADYQEKIEEYSNKIASLFHTRPMELD